jgi:hypothetical protein
MVIGIVAVIIGFIPFCGAWAIIPACAGLGLGIADIIVKSKRKQSKGMAIAGLILNPLAIIVIVSWWAYLAYATQQAVNTMDVDLGQFQNLQPPSGQGQIPTVPLPPENPPAQPMQPMQPVPATPPPGPPGQPAPPPAQPAPQPIPVQPAPQ